MARIATARARSQARTMSAPRESKLPSLLPFVVAALVLVIIYGGLLLFPTIKALVDRQDCLAAARTDCD